MLLGRGLSDGNGINVSSEFIYGLIISGRYWEAYKLLLKSNQNKADILFNLSLCCFYAEEYAKALNALDKILALPIDVKVQVSQLSDTISQSIENRQNGTDVYKAPVTIEYVEMFPDILKTSVLRLKVDCHLALEQWDMVTKTAALLQNKNYKNVNYALGKMPDKK